MADCVRNKIDSNTTGLSVAEEVCSRQLPTLADDGYDPEWFELEPNEYDDFGGDLTKTARKPINKNRRNKKGSTTDLDAVAGFNHDFVPHALSRQLQGFFFSNFREQPTTYPLNDRDARIEITGVTASNDRYAAASGLTMFATNDLVFIAGADNDQNNGLQLVDEVAATYIGVADGRVDETPTGTITITRVGRRFSAGDLSIALSGALAVLTLGGSAPVAAEGELTIADAPSDSDTVTIGSVVYTFKTVPASAYEVLIDGDNNSAINLRKAINGDLLGTPEHPLFTATDDGSGVITITAKVAGTVGNGVATTETFTDTDNVWTASATSGGTGYSLHSLVDHVGQWLFLGGDAAGTAFANNVGYARVKTIADQTLTFDKTTWTPEVEAAGSLTVEVYVGDSLRDENFELQVTKYFQFERTLGQDANGTQAEYVRGAVANELELDLPLADKINVNLGYIAADRTVRTGAQGLKSGDRFAAPIEDMFNTSTAVVRNSMAVVDPASSVPSPLFAWLTEGNLTINNNVSAVKAIGALGGIDVSVGNFDVGGEVTALFTTVEAISAVENNDDVTLDFIAARDNEAVVWDIPLLSLSGGRPEISENEPVTLGLEMMGAENTNDYTMEYTHFPYVPTIAHPAPVDTDD